MEFYYFFKFYGVRFKNKTHRCFFEKLLLTTMEILKVFVFSINELNSRHPLFDLFLLLVNLHSSLKHEPMKAFYIFKLSCEIRQDVAKHVVNSD